MPRTTSITIGEQFDAFVNRMIEDDRYGSTSEIVAGAPDYRFIKTLAHKNGGWHKLIRQN
jgi:hypothetical protein